MNRHQAPKALHFEISDLIHCWHVIVSDLEDAILAVLLETNITHKLSEGLAEEWLEAMILLDHCGHEIEATRLIEAELQQMSEINKDSHLLLINHLVCQYLVVLDGTSLSVNVLLCTLHVSLIVDIILAQLETIEHKCEFN